MKNNLSFLGFIVFVLMSAKRPPFQLGSWHSSRRHMCQYCSALRSVLPGESEGMLFTAFGASAAHRGTNLGWLMWGSIYELSLCMPRIEPFKTQDHQEQRGMDSGSRRSHSHTDPRIYSVQLLACLETC